MNYKTAVFRDIKRGCLFVPLHEEGHAHILSIGTSGELMQLCNHNGRSIWQIYDGHRSIEPSTEVRIVEFSRVGVEQPADSSAPN